MSESKPAFWVRNLSGPVYQKDRQLRSLVVPVGALTPIYDEKLRVRFVKGGGMYEIVDGDGLKLDAPPPPAALTIEDTNPEIEHPLGFVTVLSVEGGAESAMVKLQDGSVAPLREILEGLKARGECIVAKKGGKIVLFPKTSEQSEYAGLGDLLRALGDNPGLLLPPVKG